MLMRKIKLGLLMFMVIILSGCTVDYNLIITSNQKLKENVKLFVNNDQLPATTKGKKEYFQNQIDSYKNIGGYKNYEFDYKIGEELSYIQLEAWHPSFDNYQNSIIYNNLFEKVFVLETDEYITFETVGKYFYNDLYATSESPDPDFYMGDINVKIRLHNKILDSNADKVDEKNNTLEWTITEQDKVKSIYFKTGHEKRYDIMLIDMFLLNKEPITITSLIILVVTSVGYYFYRKFQKNNLV